MFKLLLLCDYTREPERRLLRGLSDFANSQGGWSYFQIPPSVYNNPARRMEIVEKAQLIKADAIFGRWSGIEKSITGPLGIPIVLRTGQQEYPDYPMLGGDYREIGRMAAEFFFKQNYLNYAFCGFSGLIWSDLRQFGFEDYLKSKGLSVTSITTDLSIPEQEEGIKEWLRNIPKPTALFAANDVMAGKIAEWCQETGINIPEELALLGVDNDEFQCNIAWPSISSIHLDFERQGRELGEAIFKMSREGVSPSVRINVHPVKIVERGSTLKHNIKDPYILRLVNYIDSNYTSPITLNDIIKDIPLSRRAIEIHFKKEMAPDTILSYLNRLRVKQMCNYLTFTNMPISLAAENSGFSDIFNVGRTFKRYTGMSPALFRKNSKNKSGTADNSNSCNKED